MSGRSIERGNYNTVRRGKPLSARDLNNAQNQSARSISVGGDIEMTRIGGQTHIQALPVKRGGAGTGFTIPIVESLPAIPSSGFSFVFWTSDGAGDGDDQIWCAYAGQTEWTPLQLLTTLSGVP